MNVPDLARRSGLSKEAFYQGFKDPQWAPTRSKRARVAMALGVSEQWLMSGGSELTPLDTSDVIEIPYFSFPRPSAGFGEDYFEGYPDGKSFMTRQARESGIGPFVACRASGTSMEPQIMRDSLMVLDLGDKTPISSKIYVFRLAGEVFVKQWASMGRPGQGRLQSANSNYPPIDVTEEHDLECIARVVAATNEF